MVGENQIYRGGSDFPTSTVPVEREVSGVIFVLCDMAAGRYGRFPLFFL